MKAKLTPDGITFIVVDVRNAYPHAEGSFAGLWPEAANQDVDHIEAVNDRIAAGKQFDLTLPRRAIPECARLITPAR